MRSMTLVALLGVLVMLAGCNATGSGGDSKVKTGCISLVKMLR